MMLPAKLSLVRVERTLTAISPYVKHTPSNINPNTLFNDLLLLTLALLDRQTPMFAARINSDDKLQQEIGERLLEALSADNLSGKEFEALLHLFEEINIASADTQEAYTKRLTR